MPIEGTHLSWELPSDNMSICNIPWEIVSYIVQDLDLDDVFHLSLSCRTFQWLIRDENLCKRLLESRAPSAPESVSARKTKEYARGLRRLVKRRAAISSASPYLVAAVASVDSYIYVNGVLCYLAESQLRVLDLHNSASQEVVINVSGLLGSDDSILAPREGHSYDFKIVHFADGYVTCCYSLRRPLPSWLVVIHIAERRAFSHVLESPHKLFVRNNAEFLYYGTHSDPSETGHRRWALRGCSLRDERWFDNKLRLDDIVGSDIHTNICFEIIDGYFYCLANQAVFEREEVDWTSYYTYLRFPVRPSRPGHFGPVTSGELFRRLHPEGPIDDRWTFLRLVKDEGSGALMIVEGRKEWRKKGSSACWRTYYTSELQFSGRRVEAATADSAAGPSSAPDLHALPDQAAGGSKAEEGVQHTRSHHQVHPGEDPAALLTFTITNSPMRSYHPSSQTFLDLVNDPLPDNPYQTRRLRLRAGSRRLRSRPELEALGDQYSELPDDTLYPGKEIKRLYKDSDVTFWPPRHWELEYGTEALQDLSDILSPRTHQGPISGTWDERSMCYATGNRDKDLVFISFDPSIHIQGIRSWRGTLGGIGDVMGAGCNHSHTNISKSTPDTHDGAVESEATQPRTNQEQDDTAKIPLSSRKGKEKAVRRASWNYPDANDWALPAATGIGEGAGSSEPAPTTASEDRRHVPHWISLDNPMYAQIRKGYHFMP